MECSFWIESKLFVLRRGGRGKFCIVDYSKLRGNRTPYQTNKVRNKVFLIQKYHNLYGRFIKLVELGIGNGKCIIAIPEGNNGNRWYVFASKVKSFMVSSSSVFRGENIGALAPKGIIVLSHRTLDMSYMLVLQAPL